MKPIIHKYLCIYCTKQNHASNKYILTLQANNKYSMIAYTHLVGLQKWIDYFYGLNHYMHRSTITLPC